MSLTSTFKTFTKLNNQHTEILTLIDNNDLYIMHDTRIIRFKNGKNYRDEILNIILDITTTNSFRLLHYVDSILKLFDTSNFLILLVTTYYSIYQKINGDNDAYNIDTGNILIAVVLATDLFYDVMISTTKIWSLNRLSFWIGILFYIFYFILFSLDYNDVPGYGWFFLGFRAFSFFTDKFVDTYQDILLYNIIKGDEQFTNLLNYIWCISNEQLAIDNDKIKIIKGHDSIIISRCDIDSVSDRVTTPMITTDENIDRGYTVDGSLWAYSFKSYSHVTLKPSILIIAISYFFTSMILSLFAPFFFIIYSIIAIFQFLPCCYVCKELGIM